MGDFNGFPLSAGSRKQLGYVSDGDTNGLFYFLGTNYGTVAWANPHTTRGQVAVGVFQASNDVANLSSGTLEGVVNRDNTDDNNSTNVASYWRFLLAGGQLICNKYSFRARPSGGGTASSVAQWKFQGSSNGTTWVDLDARTGVTYAVDNEWKTYDVAGAGSYRLFRLLWQANVTGANSLFFLSEIELYGTLAY